MSKKLLLVSLLLIGIFVASSIGIVQAKSIKNIPAHNVHKKISNSKPYHNLVIISVQTRQQYDTGHIPGAYYVPTAELETWADLYVCKNAKIIVSCTDGSVSPIAVDTLSAAGFKKVYNLEGGTNGWEAAGYELETQEPPLPLPC